MGKFRTYPLSSADLLMMVDRMVAGDTAYIPVRSDMKFLDGRVFVAGLTWGHPHPYSLKEFEGRIYGVFNWEEPEFMPQTTPGIVKPS